LLLFGPPGGGKMAAAIGLALVENGWRVLFTRTSDLVQRLQIARRELALESALAKLDKYHLLILDLCAVRSYVELRVDSAADAACDPPIALEAKLTASRRAVLGRGEVPAWANANFWRFQHRAAVLSWQLRIDADVREEAA
jgi:hypothetical protein